MSRKSSFENVVTPMDSAMSGYDIEGNDDYSNMVHRLSRVMEDPSTMERLESLTRAISTATNRDIQRNESRLSLEERDLSRLIQRAWKNMDREGVESNHIGVSFTDLSTVGISKEVNYGPSVSEALRALVDIRLIAEKLKNPPTRRIIEGFDGVVQAGEMLLVLGRPGSGCSTLLKTIAGEIDQFKRIEGDISYDGVPQAEMLKNFKSEIIYNGEQDVHFPHLNVDQTLRFAIASKTPVNRLEGVTRSQYQTDLRDMLATIFGLKHTYDTKVGNEYVRGVSGGERKRVSIAEALASRGSMYCWDNATRGLDASTALEYTQAIRASTNILRNVAVVAIYQAGENIYQLFDKVTVIYKGRQVFFGPVYRAKEYFLEMGFECPPRQTTAEFLTAVTDPNGRSPKRGFENKVPKTPEEFVQYWKRSEDYQDMFNERRGYANGSDCNSTLQRFRKVRSMEKMKHQRLKSRYLLTYPSQLRLAIRRGFQRARGNIAYLTARTVGACIQSLITGSLFYNISDSTSGAFSRGSVLFFAILFNALTSLADIPLAFENRPILLKQKSYSFYHPSVEAIQQLITDFPFRLLFVATFSVAIYFLAGLTTSVGQFFTFLLFISITAFTTSSLFQMIASLTKSSAPANSIGGIGIVMLSIYAGYLIPTPSMHPWFRWINYVNPLAYGFESLMTNEFHKKNMPCNTLVPSGPGYENVKPQNQVCAFTGSIPGQSDVVGDRYLYAQYRYQWDHAWRNLGIITGFWVFFIFVNVIATEYLRPVASGGEVLLFKRGHLPVAIHEDPVVTDKESLRNELSTGNRCQEQPCKQIFSWQNIDYTIPVKKGERKLLHDVQGYVKPGTLTALMGESGAGKTTLLNVLSQRVNFGVITGDIFVDGKPVDDSFQRRTGYVQQQDLHLAESTVREALQFAARLRQPTAVRDQEKLDYVETIIQLLGMKDYAEAYIGTIGRGLNVEQRKKLSIGVELVAKPSLLIFLDEPTSGLDSQSAWSIISFLRSLADSGQAILCTIHQPSATLFERFDRLLLLQKGGQTVYFGDIGENSNKILSYFESQGARPCSSEENPAEYILECIGAGATTQVDQDWHEIWKNSEEYLTITMEIEEMHDDLARYPNKMVDKELHKKFAAGYFTQLRYVLARTCVQYWRSPTYIMSKLAMMVVVGLFTGFTFWDVDYTLAGLRNAMFAIFIIQVLSVPLCNQIQVFSVPARELFEIREAASNTFHWSALLFSQFIAEIPYHVVFATMLFCSFYFPGKFSTDIHVAGMFYFIYAVIFQLYTISFSFLIVNLMPNAPSAAVVTSLLFSFMIQFCGVLQPLSNMPGFWTFMYKVSPYTYFMQSYLGVVFHDRVVECSPEEFNVFQPPQGLTCQDFAGPFVKLAGGYLDNPTATTNCSYCRFRTGDEYLASINIQYSYRWRNVGFFCAFILFNFIGTLLIYRFLRVRKFRFKKNKPTKAIARRRPADDGVFYHDSEEAYDDDSDTEKQSGKKKRLQLRHSQTRFNNSTSLVGELGPNNFVGNDCDPRIKKRQAYGTMPIALDDLNAFPRAVSQPVISSRVYTHRRERSTGSNSLTGVAITSMGVVHDRKGGGASDFEFLEGPMLGNRSHSPEKF
ncbi:protein Snq2p [Trichomonascus vanleenenianus]|uniref:protein Snq2p n=1 Tax=Trichomonascus vanleenenianus TaxID=2268995 RepID=UPI003EC9BBA4